MTGPAAPVVPPQPRLSKRSLSLYFRTGCERQLALHLYTNRERVANGMPPAQEGRAGLGLVGRHGYEHQAAKVAELQTAFGGTRVSVGAAVTASGQTAAVPLLPLLQGRALLPYSFIVEAEFSGAVATARTALGLDSYTDLRGASVTLSDELRPDLIQVLPSLAMHQADWPRLPPAYFEEVLADGAMVAIDPASDTRMRLRVADIKLSSEPGASYFAETVFYSMVLAAWLQENQLANRYAVVAAPAVVPGSMDDSALLTALATARAVGQTLSPAAAAIAWEGDLELAPVEAFAPRILQLTKDTLRRVVNQPWNQLPFHVDFRCQGCEFLGDPHIMSNGAFTQDPLHCWPDAERSGHLSRVFGLSRGATESLRANQVADTPALAAVTPATSTAAFGSHQGLKSKRTVFPERARSLQQQTAGLIPASGGDALMPKWPSLHLYLFLDYDPATAFTVSMGCRAFWLEPLPFGSGDTRQAHRWGRAQGDTEVFLVDLPNVAAERREFLRFLRHLRDIFDWVDRQDDADGTAGRRDNKTRHSTYQIYLWDEAQRRHFVRLVSRHLGAILSDPQLKQLAWLFPPPELLALPEESTRRTPYTLVYDVVENTVAVPSPHHYTLIDVTRLFNAGQVNPPSVHPRYLDTLSNLIPPERIHEFWKRVQGWRQVQDLLVETTTKKLAALGMVVRTLEDQLGPMLSRHSAPRIPSVPTRPRLAPEGYLWCEFTRLNAALDSVEKDRVRSMPPHEREARFKSAWLVRRLHGAEEQAAWQRMHQASPTMSTVRGALMIYEMNADSRDLNARPGDFNYALSPRDAHGFLEMHPYQLFNGAVQAYGSTVDAAGLTMVAIVAIDRASSTIALEGSWRSKFPELLQYAGLDFETDVMLDPISRDYLSDKVELTMRGIGNPPSALPQRRVFEALGLPVGTRAGNSPMTPAAEVLWQGGQLHTRGTNRNLLPIRNSLHAFLTANHQILMADQWAAWEHALGFEMTLIWGPPGTGKSHTLRAILLGAYLEAAASNRPLRVLISAITYTAVDNVLLKFHEDMQVLNAGGATHPYSLYRVQGSKRTVDHDFARYPTLTNIELNKRNPSPMFIQLTAALDNPTGMIVVGAPAQQVHNMAVAGINKPRGPDTQKNWFDLILIDEASQMDVATSTLVLSKRASHGACVLAGDDLQLPPIHEADAPEGLENVVGSIYNFVRHERQVPPDALNASFRSNETLIGFTRLAGYDVRLHAHSPDLALNLDPVPSTSPANWPTSLPWSPDYQRVLDPAHPAICLLHQDRASSQANKFEADHAASIATLLRSRLRDGLLNELDPSGNAIVRAGASLYAAAGFWDRGIGIVVPHRAQMSLIASQLIAAFPNDPPERIRQAVDTVERFQGQQRDVIIASFGLGDPDVIASEEEFLFSLRRFNVLASRARAKLIVIVSRTVVEHLSNDADILGESLLLKRYVEQFCQAAPNQAPAGLWELRWR
jgi:DNA replication ATP-dependent helicase Dna2